MIEILNFGLFNEKHVRNAYLNNRDGFMAPSSEDKKIFVRQINSSAVLKKLWTKQ